MGNPWGISGPDFIWLYVVGFIVALVLKFSVVPRLGAGAPGTDVRLDAYRAAYLAGGSNRVVNTAIAALALRGQVLVSREGELSAADGVIVRDPIESSVYHALGPVQRRLPSLYRQLSCDTSIRAIRDELVSRGLLVAGADLWPYRLALSLPIAVWITGLVRLINGARLHRPIGILVLLLVLSGIAILFVLAAEFAARERPSAGGRRYLGLVRAEYGVSVPVLDADVDHTAWSPELAAVAVLGFAAVPDEDLRRALMSGPPSSGSGGGCGGGGCGGGGCGGGCGG